MFTGEGSSPGGLARIEDSASKMTSYITVGRRPQFSSCGFPQRVTWVPLHYGIQLPLEQMIPERGGGGHAFYYLVLEVLHTVTSSQIYLPKVSHWVLLLIKERRIRVPFLNTLPSLQFYFRARRQWNLWSCKLYPAIPVCFSNISLKLFPQPPYMTMRCHPHTGLPGNIQNVQLNLYFR